MKCREVTIGIIEICIECVSGTDFCMNSFWSRECYTRWNSWSNGKAITYNFTKTSILEVDNSSACFCTCLECCCSSSFYKCECLRTELGITTTDTNFYRHVPVFYQCTVLSLYTKIHRYFLPYLETSSIRYIDNYIGIRKYWARQAEIDFFSISGDNYIQRYISCFNWGQCKRRCHFPRNCFSCF